METVTAATGSLSVESGVAARQVVPIGFPARAVFLWWSREVEDGADPRNQGGMGVAAAGSQQASVGWAAAGNELGWWSSDAALIGYQRPGAADAELRSAVSWTEDGFSLEQTAGGEGRWHVRYLAFGGDPCRAAVCRFEIDESGATSVRGLGLEPALMLFVAGAGGGPAPSFPSLVHGIGAATGPDSQVAAALTAWAGDGRASVRGAQRQGAVLTVPDPLGLQRPSAFARLASVDGDGFTLETALENTGPLSVACLALAGGEYEVGVATAPTARKRKETRTRTLSPDALLAFSWGFAPSPVPKEFGRLCVGSAARAGETGCISWSLRGRPAWPLRPSARFSAGSFLEVVDTTSEGLHTQAAFDGFLPTGFALDWLLADEFRREFAYVGVGARSRRSLRPRLRSGLRRLRP